MLTPSESLDKLSASMAELSRRAKEAEDHTAAARSEARDQLEARVAEAKTTARQRREELKARGAELTDEIASSWDTLRTQVQEQLDKIGAKLGEKRDYHDVKVAQHRAEWAERNAADAVDFALFAIDEAEAAVFEAAHAGATAEAVRESTPSPRQG